MTMSTKGVILAAVGLVAVVLVIGPQVPAQPNTRSGVTRATEGQIASHVVKTANGDPLLVLVDGSERRVGVYHVDPGTGVISLKSVRNVTHDLQLSDHNTNRPTPDEVWQALQSR